jgi:hypothetical protein
MRGSAIAGPQWVMPSLSFRPVRPRCLKRTIIAVVAVAPVALMLFPNRDGAHRDDRSHGRPPSSTPRGFEIMMVQKGFGESILWNGRLSTSHYLFVY